MKNLLEDSASYKDYRLTIINPVDFYNFEEKRYQSEKEVMNFDLFHLRSSDIVIVNVDGLSTSIGSIIEIYEAYKNSIPVFVFGKRYEYEKLHPWVKEMITRVECSDNELLNYYNTIHYIEDFYMI